MRRYLVVGAAEPRGSPPKRTRSSIPTAGNPASAPARYSSGIAANVGEPLGEFAQNVGTAFGLDGFGTLGLDSRGIFSLRAQLGWLQYSSKDGDILDPEWLRPASSWSP